MARQTIIPVETCGPGGCSIEPAAANISRAIGPVLNLQIVSDTICPWCYVAKEHLKVALAKLESDGIHLDVHWIPFELNPDMPKAGLDRKEYRSRKFGSWDQSQSLDAGVAAAGKAAGLEFRHDLMTRTPNTFDSHRLVWLAGKEGVQDKVVDALFRGYFSEGRDVGNIEVLADIASAAGIDRERVKTFLASTEGTEEVRREIEMGRRAGTQGVPTFVLNDEPLFSGAQPASVMETVFREIAAESLHSAAEARDVKP